MNKKIIFHVPHAGCVFPKELMQSITIPIEQFIKYHCDMTDTCAYLFIPENSASQKLIFNTSCLLCDVERFIDGTEIMDNFGMGYCYERVYDGTKIKSISQELKEKTLKIYLSHHKRLDGTVENYHGDVMLFDLHSFSDLIVMRDTLESICEFPDICIGYEDSRARSVADFMTVQFQYKGLRVSHNYPYKGSILPNAVLRGNSPADVISVMIEVNKKTYLYDNGNNIYSINYDTVRTVRNIINSVKEIYKY